MAEIGGRQLVGNDQGISIKNENVDLGASASVVVDDKEAWCPVCLEKLGANGEVSEMPCGHRYHVDCIMKWLEKHNTCPLCRFLIPMEENKPTNGGLEGEEEGGRTRRGGDEGLRRRRRRTRVRVEDFL